MISIRKGVKEDKSNYLIVQLQAFPTESEERHKKYFDQKIDRDEIFVLELDGEYVGHLTYSKFISPPFTNSFYAEEFAILEKHRSKGYGIKLMKELIKECKRIGFEKVWLDTWGSRKNKAISFYKKHGFKRCGEIKKEKGKQFLFCLKIKEWKD